jgi:hypothetical protein
MWIGSPTDSAIHYVNHSLLGLLAPQEDIIRAIVGRLSCIKQADTQDSDLARRAIHG